MYVVYHEDKEHKEFLRLMLAELLEKQSAPMLSDAERQFCRKGISALKRSIANLDETVYA